jgi:arginine N-succinyltransferase
VGSLFLSPDYRRGGNGRLLSLSRFLFMADHLDYFDPVVISELRGITDKTGRSPFWDAVGHHFFDIDFPSADYLSMVDKKFIADLMPEHPLYIPLLPYSAQSSIGKVQPETEPALAMLKSEGFELNGMVDIFDAGPVVRCPLKQIRSIRESAKLRVESIAQLTEGTAFLIANSQQNRRSNPLRAGQTIKNRDLRCAELDLIDPSSSVSFDVILGVRNDIAPKPFPFHQPRHR